MKNKQSKDGKQLFTRNTLILRKSKNKNRSNRHLQDSEEEGSNNGGIIIPISNCHSEAITTSIQIGGDTTQRFDVIIDTTTMNTWVPSSKCETCEYLNTYDYDDGSRSSEYKVIAPTIDVTHGIEISGDAVTSNVHLGSVTINEIEFGAISTFPDEFYPICGSVDGVIGLGKGDGGILSRIIKDGSLPNPIISLYLNVEADDFMIDINNRRLLSTRRNLPRSKPNLLGNRNTDEDDDDYEDEDGEIEFDDDDNGEVGGDIDDTDAYIDDNNQLSEIDDTINDNIEDDDNDAYMTNEVLDDNELEEALEEEEEEEEYYEDAYEQEELPEQQAPPDDYRPEGLPDEEYPDKHAIDEEYVDDYGMVDDVYDVGGGEEYTPRPKFARSELVLGGVNPKHYDGCLSWHPAINNDNTWSIKIDFGDDEPAIASLSTITDIVHGPTTIIGDYLTANNAQCYDLVHQKTPNNEEFIEEQEQPQNDSLGEEKDCKTETFDVAFYDCKNDENGENFKPFEFEASSTDQSNDKKQKYVLGFDELIEEYIDNGNGYEETEDVVCAFRMKALSSSEQGNQWILGTPMFEKYYVAFNIEQNTIGLAPSRYTSSLTDVCDADSSLFVSSIYQKATTSMSGGVTSNTSGKNNDPTLGLPNNASDETGLNEAEEGGGFSISSVTKYAQENNNALIVIPILIVVVFIIGLLFKRRRRNTTGMIDSATRSTPGINYDFVDPSCQSYVSGRSTSIAADDDGNGAWEGYDDRHQIT